MKGEEAQRRCGEGDRQGLFPRGEDQPPLLLQTLLPPNPRCLFVVGVWGGGLRTQGQAQA